MSFVAGKAETKVEGQKQALSTIHTGGVNLANDTRQNASLM